MLLACYSGQSTTVNNEGEVADVSQVRGVTRSGSRPSKLATRRAETAASPRPGRDEPVPQEIICEAEVRGRSALGATRALRNLWARPVGLVRGIERSCGVLLRVTPHGPPC